MLLVPTILLAAGYYAVIDQPIRTAINEAKSQQDELNTEAYASSDQGRFFVPHTERAGFIEQSGSLGKMGEATMNSKAELDELNQLLEMPIHRYRFSDVTRDGDLIRRSLSADLFSGADYDKATRPNATVSAQASGDAL